MSKYSTTFKYYYWSKIILKYCEEIIPIILLPFFIGGKDDFFPKGNLYAWLMSRFSFELFLHIGECTYMKKKIFHVYITHH